MCMHEMQIFFILKFFWKKVYKTNIQIYTSLNNEAFQPYSFHTRVQGESLILGFLVWILIINRG